MSIYAAYGSTKDISVYKDAGINTSQMYIVGKANKKLQVSPQR